ncbi:hypothetical protein HR11_03740 [Porphyromonas macacae]|nr:hypothetical protein HR11_03740 [Porphyromonas macacae]
MNFVHLTINYFSLFNILNFFCPFKQIFVPVLFSLLCILAEDSTVLQVFIAAYVGVGKIPVPSENNFYRQKKYTCSDDY